MQSLFGRVASMCVLPVALALTSDAPAATAKATAEFKDREGKVLGSASLRETNSGVLVDMKLQGLPPGRHGFHIHAIGKCEGDFESAGPVHNPLGASYGLLNPEGPMAGNLANLIASPSGDVEVEFVTTFATIGDGPEESLLDSDGSAFIITDKPDDHISEPDGNSGGRIACGVITLAK